MTNRHSNGGAGSGLDLRRLVWWVGVGLVACVLQELPRFGSAEAGRLPRSGGVVRIRLAKVPDHLDPLRLVGEDGVLVSSFYYEGLTRCEPDGPVAALALRWTRDDEGRRWLFWLRRDVVFHDGTPCDGPAVLESLQRLADPRRSAYAWILSDLTGWNEFATGKTNGLEGLTFVAPDRLELHFSSPVMDLPERLAIPAAGIARRQKGAWLGTGAFAARGASPGRLRLVAFENHHSGRPFLDEIELVSERVTEKVLRDDVADMMRVSVAEPLPAGAIRVRAPASRLGLALVQPGSRVLGSPALRQRLAEGFDRRVFVRAVLDGDGEGATGFSPRAPQIVSSQTVEPKGDLSDRPRERARIVVAESEPVLRALGERLQVHLFALGLNADLDVLPALEFEEALELQRYDLVLLGWTPHQPRLGGLDTTSRIRYLTGALLKPVLGNSFHSAWSGVLAGTAKNPEAVLLAKDFCIPLVFFHDIWQTSADVLNVRPATASAGLDLTNAHLDPSFP